MNIAVVLSGGIGTRLGLEVPKQYVRIKEHMLITYALISISKSPFVEGIWIVSDTAWQKEILEDVEAIGLDVKKICGFARPGENRQLSIVNGMMSAIYTVYGNNCRKNTETVPGCLEDTVGNIKYKEFDESFAWKISADDTVFVHDAARPFLTEEMIERCYNALSGHDGVMPVLPMKDTVYISEGGGLVTELLERNKVYSGQAPELFNLKKYWAANVALMPEDILYIHGSTEAAIRFGMDVTMVEGDEANFKVTTKADLKRCQEIIVNEGVGTE